MGDTLTSKAVRALPWKTYEAEKIVKKFVRQEKSGERMGLFTEDDRRVMEREAVKGELAYGVGVEFSRGLDWIMRRVHPALRRGVIPSIYVDDGLRRILRALARVQKDFLKESGKLLPQKELEEAIAVADRIDQILRDSTEGTSAAQEALAVPS